MQILYGIHPVEEALKAGKRRFDHVLVARERRDDRLEAIVSLCRELKIRVRTEPRETLTDMARTPAHQGVVAIVRAQQFLTIEDVLEPTGSPRLVLALDGVEDPQNLGALLRSADGAGVDSVVMTERRAAQRRRSQSCRWRPGASPNRPGRQSRTLPRRAEAQQHLDHRFRRARHNGL